ncbi:lambda-exonuclease family protein [Streptomyces sp. NBC_01565]|uniref:YqaJ viral recombinase family nuclease n=1 Tax=Streptomyces sp. NBC_01565 TaxID=2975881 RepID=UPI002251DDB5|nr:YqaJ viral recombinase family protein [Streptomyces sp. NBC_01565]MCX4540461.1 YqaJ viral recombinase family protein [Streptomyces sp. NBC_01565]
MTETVQAGASAPAAGRRVTPTGRLILSADADRADWLTARRSGIGSSDAPAILGLIKENPPLKVYLDKLGHDVDDAGEAAYWGTVNEEPVARRWAMQNRSVIRRVGLVAHVDHPHWMTTLDRRVLECPLAEDEQEACALEVKTRSAFKAAQWHAGAPDDVLAQVLWQIIVNGYGHMHYAVLIGGNEYHQGVVRADQHADVMADITTAMDRFWFEHVQAQVPPELTGDGEALTRLFRRLHPTRSGEVDIDRHDDALDALLDYGVHQRAEAAEKKAKNAAKARMIAALGGAQAALIGGERAYSLEPSNAAPRVDLELLAERWPDAYAACVAQNPTERIDIAKQFKGGI